jgi:hypothetical protein
VPRHASTTACTKGMGLLRTSQARDARCLCTCVSAIYTFQRLARPFDIPSEARVAWSLIIRHWVGPLRCVARWSCITSILAGGHGHIHDAMLSSSAALNAPAISSRSYGFLVSCLLVVDDALVDLVFEGRWTGSGQAKKRGGQQKCGGPSPSCLEAGFYLLRFVM